MSGLLGKNGLPPAHGSTDDVPFQVGEDFIPPEKVTLPLNFNFGNPTDALFMDYDFTLEDKVLEWTEFQHKLQLQAAATRKARIAQKEEEEAQEKQEQEKKEQEQQQNDTPAPTTSAESSAAGPSASMPAMAATSATFNPPFADISSGSILMPAPIKANAQANESAVKTQRATSFDLADFEQEQDPFEHMELKVLDDMAELDKVLQSSQAENKDSKAIAENGENGNANQTMGNLSLTENPPASTAQLPPVTTASQSLKDVEYPDIDSIGSTDSALSIRSNSSHAMPSQLQQNIQHPQHQLQQQPQQQQQPPQQPQQQQQQPQQLSPHSQSLMAGTSSVVALPPMPATSSMVSQPAAASSLQQPPPSYTASLTPMYSLSQAPGTNYTQAKTYSSLYQQNHGSQLPMQQQQLPAIPAMWNANVAGKPSNASNDFLAQYNHNNSSSIAAKSSIGQLRRNKSTPDIHSMVEDERRVMPTSHTPPPYRTKTPPPPPPKPTELQQQDSNRQSHLLHNSPRCNKEGTVSISGGKAQFSPPQLPPMSSSSISQHASPSQASIPSSSIKPASQSPAVPTRPAPKLPDPFWQLPHEAQRFVNNISDMGFPKARVARAVEKLGQDDKKVVDHLCAINRLEDMGFSPDPAELALQMFENKIEKAEKYLNLVKQFKDFGFTETKIREALLKNNLDEHKTLDCLTAS